MCIESRLKNIVNLRILCTVSVCTYVLSSSTSSKLDVKHSAFAADWWGADGWV